MLLSRPLVVLDTETTGLSRWSRVIEIGAVLLGEDGEERATFSSLVNPGRIDRRADAALRVNGLTRAELAAAPSTEQVRARWMAWLAEADPRAEMPWCTAFNIGFDDRMLLQSGFPKLRWASCVMKRAAPLVKGRPSRSVSLAAAAAHFGVRFEAKAHRALTDARVTAGVVRAIRREELK